MTRIKNWLLFVDTYRTFCPAPGPEARELLLGIQEITHGRYDKAIRYTRYSMKQTAFFAALILIFGAVPFAGQAPSPAARQETPTLRVTTRLVQTNVIVQNKKGEPVPNLTKDDFVLLEDGKEQHISVFAMESNRPVAGAPAPEPLPPNTFTNTFEYRPNMPTSITVILLDVL